MRLNYFGYCLMNSTNSQSHLFDLTPMIRAFCAVNSVPYKNRFIYKGEHLYLFPATPNIYLFVMTRSNEIIKRINANDLNVHDIYELLGQGDQLGFASYIYLRSNSVGFASTFFAPKISAFVYLIDSIFESLELQNIKFRIQALLYQASKTETLNMPFLGKTTIEIAKENNIAIDFLNFVNATPDDIRDLDSFEIIIKPKKRKNIKPLIGKLVNRVSDEGLEKMIVKAKDSIQDHLADLYLVGMGAISDKISTKNPQSIYQSIIDKTTANLILIEKIQEFIDDERFAEAAPQILNSFGDVNSWTPFVSNIQ